MPFLTLLLPHPGHKSANQAFTFRGKINWYTCPSVRVAKVKRRRRGVKRCHYEAGLPKSGGPKNMSLFSTIFTSYGSTKLLLIAICLTSGKLTRTPANCGIGRNATCSKRKRCWFRGNRLGELLACPHYGRSPANNSFSAERCANRKSTNTSQYLLIQSCEPWLDMSLFSRHFNGNVVCTTWQAVRGESGGRKWANRKPRSPLNTTLCFISHRVARIPMLAEAIQIGLLVLGS